MRRRAVWGGVAALVVLGGLIVALVVRAPTPPGGDAAPQPPADGSAWSGWGPCDRPEQASLRCATLTVPLDRSRPDTARLPLAVAAGGRLDADRTLLVLTGGPGQPGASLAARVLGKLPHLSAAFRIVLIDQRGTGQGALSCPDLQAELGDSDLEVPSAHAVAACAAALGDSRAHYATGDTVADLEALRQELGVPRWSLDGVSYGSYVAQRYAAAHPDHVDRLVLDSVVPLAGIDATGADTFASFAEVLRARCQETGCTSDPADDLSAVVTRYHLGPQLLDVLSVMSVADPTFGDLPRQMQLARAGDPGPLRATLDAWQNQPDVPASDLSQALHASTMCLDLKLPWGGPQTPLDTRGSAADRAVAQIPPERLYPFDAATARSNGEMRTCELWPPIPDAPAAPGPQTLTGVDTLLLAGDRDLSTPLVWARAAQQAIPGSRLVVVPHAGHSVQTRGPASVEQTVAQFLTAG